MTTHHHSPGKRTRHSNSCDRKKKSRTAAALKKNRERTNSKKMEPLTEAELNALSQVSGGADVYDMELGILLRRVAKRRPDLLKVGRPQKAPTNVLKRQPYFGAMPTKKGEALL